MKHGEKQECEPTSDEPRSRFRELGAFVRNGIGLLLLLHLQLHMFDEAWRRRLNLTFQRLRLQFQLGGELQ